MTATEIVLAYYDLGTDEFRLIPQLTNANFVDLKSGRKNLLFNAKFKINQRAFGGGQPAAGVYGFDRWKGDALGTRIQQFVENTDTINDVFTISWTGGDSGVADVDATTGLSSGDSFTLSTSANISVIVPTTANNIQLEKGSVATELEFRNIADDLALCQRYAQIVTWLAGSGYASRGAGSLVAIAGPLPLPVQMRIAPSGTVTSAANIGRLVNVTDGTIHASNQTVSITGNGPQGFAWLVAGAVNTNHYISESEASVTAILVSEL